MACGWIGRARSVGTTGRLGAATAAGREANPGAAEDRRGEWHGVKRRRATIRRCGDPWQIPASPLRCADLGRNFLQDQKQIWTSPSRLRFSDTEWLVPLAGISAGLLVTDRDVSQHLSHDPKTD